MSREMIRQVLCQPLTDTNCEIRLYDAGQAYASGYLRTRIEVELDRINAKTGERVSIFSGSDMYMSVGAGMCDDSDESVRQAISMVCMRKGDTDPDWFDCYTDLQMDWAESYCCEALSMHGMEPEKGEEMWDRWTNLDGWDND